MSRTIKDLKSHKKGFGEYGHKPQRKMTPYIHNANKIAGRNEVLSFQPENDISQEGFNKDHWHNAKNVRSLRKQVRAARDYVTSQARTRIKRQDKKDIDNLEL